MLDVVLEEPKHKYLYMMAKSFNPCCAGCSSGSQGVLHFQAINHSVSILVVLDVVLEE